jgi:hypothetical protein
MRPCAAARFFPPVSVAIAIAVAVASAGLLAAVPAAAQPSVDLIQRGRNLFEDQRYEESIQTLSGALVRPNNTLEQKLEIYRLLALSYITLGRADEAEAAVRGLLVLDPAYELPRSESPRFRDFFAAVRLRWESEGRPGLTTSPQAPRPVSLKHASPPEAAHATDVPLRVYLVDPDRRVAAVLLYYRTGATGRFIPVPTQLDVAGGTVRAVVPARAVSPPFVEYYLLATDRNGLAVASRGDADAPLRISVPESRGWFLPLAIGGGVAVAGAVVAVVLLTSSSSGGAKSQSMVNIGFMHFGL